MASTREKKTITISVEVEKSSKNVSAAKKIEASTSNPPPKPPKAASNSTKKETKPNICGKCKTVEAVFKTKSKRWVCKTCLTEKIKKCENCEYEGTYEKVIKHMEYFCGKENCQWWNIRVSEEFQQCFVKGGFGKALCRYKLESNTFTFEIYTDIPCFELYKYKAIVNLKAKDNNIKKIKSAKIEFGAEYDWIVTVEDWEKEDFGNDFQVKVNICLKSEVQSDGPVASETITNDDTSNTECNSDIVDLK